jgi:ActR/RegA family two-component response regulator
VLTNALIKANNSTQAQPTAPAKAQEIDAYAQLRKVTKEQVLEALKKNDENVSATARELGVDRKTVRKHIPAKRDKPSTVKRTANNPFGL